MPVLSTTRTNVILLVGLLFGQLMLMAGSAGERPEAANLRGWFSRVTSPIITAAGTIGGAVGDFVDNAGDLIAADSRNRELESELARLRTELRLVREASNENIRLRRLLEMRENLVPVSIGASVVTANLTGQEMGVVIDRGAADGLRLDLPAVAWGGAVGRIVSLDATHAVLRLLTDPNSGVAGIVQGSGAQGMVVGQGTDVLEMLYVPRFSSVIHGDRVVTSGLDGIFPRGFGIGEVIEIQEKPDGSQTILLRPELDYHKMKELLVLAEPVGGELLSHSGVDRPR
ncbi:MAG TPA: rod shape-determining protein MreC [Candidatus Polarisedimenticolaceae bacterium]|nr:rod shape-determining protein MreC [Candidatus Polarisedimenticolaceae bacterium]